MCLFNKFYFCLEVEVIEPEPGHIKDCIDTMRESGLKVWLRI